MTDKVYHYKFPNTNGLEGWAEFLLCESGMVAAVSDYGNYAFAWRCRGEGVGIREFVAQIDEGYAYSKFHEGPNLYDGEKTKKEVLELAKQSGLGSATIELIGSVIEDEFSDLADSEDFTLFMSRYDDYIVGVHLFDLQECYSTSPEQQCLQFCDKTLKRLQEALKAELAEEKKRLAHDAFVARAYLGDEP